MRKWPVLLLIIFMVLLGSRTVFAKGKGRSKSEEKARPRITERQRQRTREAQRMRERLRDDANVSADSNGQERMQRRQERIKQQVQKQKSRDEDRSKETESSGKGKGEGKGKGKGKEHQQQIEAFTRQMNHKQNKHRERAARLKRLFEVAKEKGDDKAIGRIEKLMAKEQGLYNRKMKRSMEKLRRIKQTDTPAKKDDENK